MSAHFLSEGARPLIVSARRKPKRGSTSEATDPRVAWEDHTTEKQTKETNFLERQWKAVKGRIQTRKTKVCPLVPEQKSQVHPDTSSVEPPAGTDALGSEPTDESTHYQKLMLEYEKYHELYLKIHSVQQECEQRLHSMEESKTRALEEMMQSYEAKLEEKRMLLNQFQDESQQKVREFEEYIKKQEVDTDIEIHDIRIKYEQNLKKEKKANATLKVELDATTKSLSGLQTEMDNRNLENEKLKQEVQKLQAVIRSLEKNTSHLEATNRNKEGILQQKENSIYDLTMKNSTLKKALEVMNHRAEFMEEDIAPKDQQIEELTEQIQKMEGELKEFHTTNTELELKIDEMSSKLTTKDKELRKEMKKVQDFGVLVQRFKADLHTCVECIQDPKGLKDNIRELYKCYVQPSDMVENVGVHTDMQRENIRLREHYEKIITTMKKQISRDANVFQANNTKLMKDNVVLMKEINDLRQELHTVRTQLHD